jgi:short-subunit dehydrogenase
MSYALITGASKGIGKSISIELAKQKWNLLLVARSENELKEVAATLSNQYGIKTDFLAIDLSNQDAPEKVKNWCITNNYPVSILINNAGFGLWGWFENLGLKEQLNTMHLNMNSLVELTYQLLPILKQNKKSYILNVASTAAYQAISGFTVYAATKSFVLQFSRGLRMELRNSTVSVSCLCPGGTATNFMDSAGMQAMQSIGDKVNMSSEEVAQIGVKGMFNNKAEIVPGLINRVAAQLSYFMPKSLTEKIAAGIYEKHLKKQA